MLINTLLFAVLTICVITDIKHRKIYNKIIFPALAVGFVLQLATKGWAGFLGSLTGFMTGLGLLLIPYLLGGMGAGDVKLLALIGALKGTSFVLYTAIYMAVAGGAIALVLILLHKTRIRHLKMVLCHFKGLFYGIKVPFSITNAGLSETYPYGVAIACGALFHFIYQGQVILW